MAYLSIALLPLTAAVAIPQSTGGSYFGFGNAFSTGPVADGSGIIEANTTLVLPELNSPHNGNLALWPGMGMSDGDLVQGLAISTVGVGSPCNLEAGDNKWCVTASTLEQNQEDGDVYEADPGDHVTYHCGFPELPPSLCDGVDDDEDKYNDETTKFDQTVSVNGNVVSTLSTSSGYGLGWGTAIECQSEACGTLPQHQYLDTKITMKVADPNYDQTLGLTNAEGDLVTSDGGKTWTVDTITIDEYTFT